MENNEKSREIPNSHLAKATGNDTEKVVEQKEVTDPNAHLAAETGNDGEKVEGEKQTIPTHLIKGDGNEAPTHLGGIELEKDEEQ